MPPIISVFEHQWLTEQDFGQVQDFAWLVEQDFEVFKLGRRHGRWQLRVGHYIGVVRLPSGTLLEILPKIVDTRHHGDSPKSASETQQQSRRWVQQMLTDLSQGRPGVLRPKQLGQLIPNLQSQQRLSPPLSQWWLTEFANLLVDYIPVNNYSCHAQNNSSLQGKLLIKQQLQLNAHRPHQFITEVSHIAKQTLSNRFINQAWQQLIMIATGQDSQSGHLDTAPLEASLSLRPAQLYKLMQQWSQVGTLTLMEWRQLDSSYTKAEAELKIATVSAQQKQLGLTLLDLAYWLLKIGSVSSVGAGIKKGDLIGGASRSGLQLSLLINMNHAFESWVGNQLAQQFFEYDPSYQLAYQPQKPWLIDHAGRACVTTVPDICVNYQGSPKLIIDVKWKAIQSGRDLSAKDAYQLAAYAQAYQVNRVWLIYPSLGSSDRFCDQSDSQLSCPKLERLYQHNEAMSDFEICLLPFDVMSGQVLGAFDNLDDNFFEKRVDTLSNPS